MKTAAQTALASVDSNGIATPGRAASGGSTAKERRAARRAAATAGEGGDGTVEDAPQQQEQGALSQYQPVPAIGDSVVSGDMNAKERRAAKRKAEQALASTTGSAGGGDDRPTSNATATSSTQDGTAPPASDGGSSMTAKDRRKAKRAAERASAPTTAPAPSSPSLPSITALKGPPIISSTGSTAKERRAAKRAAARAGGAATSFEGVAAPNASADVTGGARVAEVDLSGKTAKERRLLRRQAERQKRERDEGDGAATGGAPAKRSKGGAPGARVGAGGPTTPHIVFVGQLAFSTTAKGLEEHFRTRGEVEGKMSVRLLTRKGTNPPRSKGMAFVEVEDAETAYKCLGLHHSRLDGRLLNVERTSGGGKGTKGARIKETRDEQKVFMKSVVQRVLKEFIDAGRLGEKELDDQAKEVLEKMEAKVMERAVKDYCDKPDRLDLQNPSAWFTHHAHELCFRADPEDLDAGARDWLNDEKVKAAGRDRDRQKGAKRGGGRGGIGGSRGGRAGGRGFRDEGGWGSRENTSNRDNASKRYDTREGRDRNVVGPSASESSRPKPALITVGIGSTAGNDGDGGNGQTGNKRSSTESATGQAITGSSGDLTTAYASRGDRWAAGGSQGEGNDAPERSPSGRADLMSIFPSLRGRGGGRGGGMGGRGAGGRGLRQGGIHA